MNSLRLLARAMLAARTNSADDNDSWLLNSVATAVGPSTHKAIPFECNLGGRK
jgi:hypothetical protein